MQVNRCADNFALASQDGMPSDAHNGKGKIQSCQYFAWQGLLHLLITKHAAWLQLHAVACNCTLVR